MQQFSFLGFILTQSENKDLEQHEDSKIAGPSNHCEHN